MRARRESRGAGLPRLPARAAADLRGHTDTLGVATDGRSLAEAARALAQPFAAAGVTKVAGIEARGFVFATAVALELGAGFVPIRKPGSVHPGPKLERVTAPSWRGVPTTLRVQRGHVSRGDRVLVVDDWAETGSLALVEECAAAYLGLSLLVDQLSEETRARLAPVAFVIRHDEVPPNT